MKRNRLMWSTSRVLVALALSFVAALAVAPAPARADYAGFADVGTADWYVTDGSLDYALENGLLKGYGTTFGPGGKVIRGDVATVLWRIAGEPDAGVPTFADVPEGAYYARAVAWAQEKGIVTGYSDTDFGPLDPVTREQLAAMLQRYAENVAGLETFSDCGRLYAAADSSDVSDYAFEAMGWCMDEGILSGESSGGHLRVRPKGTAVRAEMAKMATVFHRDVLGLGGSEQPGQDEPPTFDDDRPSYATLREGVKELDGRVLSVTPSGEGYAVQMEGVTMAVEPGDVVLLPTCEAFPNGGALKVSAVGSGADAGLMAWGDSGSSIWMQGLIPTVSDVYSNFHINLDVTLEDLVSASASVAAKEATGGSGVRASASPDGLSVGADLVFDQVSLSGTIDFSDFYLRAHVDSLDTGSALFSDVEHYIDVQMQCAMTPSVSVKVSALPDKLQRIQVFSIPIPCAGVKGLGLNVNVYLTLDVTGEIGFSTTVSFDGSVEKDYQEERPRLEASVRCRGMEQSMAVSGQVGLQPAISLELVTPLLDLGVESGVGAKMERFDRPNGMVCGNVSAWFYSKAAATLFGNLLGDDLELALDVFDEESSPFRTPPYHVEDGVRVEECTWEQMSEIETALSRNPSVVHSTQSSQNSEVVTLTGTVCAVFRPALDGSGTQVPVYYLQLPREATVEGTQYGPMSSDKIIVPLIGGQDVPRDFIGKVVSVRTGLSVRVSGGIPEAGISMLWCNNECELVRVF